MDDVALLIILVFLVLISMYIDWQQLKDELRDMRDEEEQQRENDHK